MAKLYADEQFLRPVVELLRGFGYDILTVQESSNAGFSDPQVLEFVIANERAVITQNRRDFKRLHQLNSNYAGIIICIDDRDSQRLADRIHEAILTESPLKGKLIRMIDRSPFTQTAIVHNTSLTIKVAPHPLDSHDSPRT